MELQLIQLQMKPELSLSLAVQLQIFQIERAALAR